MRPDAIATMIPAGMGTHEEKLNTEDVWAEIDLSAIAHNVGAFKRILAPGCRLMVAVKANAYGHGLLEVSVRALAHGADALGVARFAEALRIRRAGITAPVLIFGHTPGSCAGQLVDYDLIPTIYSRDTAELLSDAATALGKKVRAHLKVDTGMGRLGILARGAVPDADNEGDMAAGLDEATAIHGLPGIDLEGIYTHFATADESNKGFAYRQLAVFNAFIGKLRARGIEFAVRHAANSAAAIDMPETHLDMVRVGISIYGIYPSDMVNHTRICLKPAMSIKTRIIHLKQVDAGFPVSYGGDAVTTRPATIATVGIGYGDGYRRLLSTSGRMLVRGQSAPVIGRVCMDLTMLDVSDVVDARLGDEVVVIGSQGNESVTADEVARKTNTIGYEVVTAVSDRVRRVYLG
jgi:alanine racemase